MCLFNYNFINELKFFNQLKKKKTIATIFYAAINKIRVKVSFIFFYGFILFAMTSDYFCFSFFFLWQTHSHIFLLCLHSFFMCFTCFSFMAKNPFYFVQTEKMHASLEFLSPPISIIYCLVQDCCTRGLSRSIVVFWLLSCYFVGQACFSCCQRVLRTSLWSLPASLWYIPSCTTKLEFLLQAPV